MPPSSCDPCGCIPGNMSREYFQQAALTVLCGILEATGGGGADQIVGGTLTAIGLNNSTFELEKKVNVSFSAQVVPTVTNAATPYQVDLEASTNYPAVGALWTVIGTYTDLSTTMLSFTGLSIGGLRFNVKNFTGTPLSLAYSVLA